MREELPDRRRSAPTRAPGEGPRRAARRGGFTLVELAIASVLLLVAILGALRTGVTTHDLVLVSAETRTAQAELEAAMERLLLLPLESVPILSSEFAAGVPVAAFEDARLRDERVVATYPAWAGGVVPDPLEIVLTITWTDFAGRPRALSMRTMKTK